jgi:hypothetical protein
MANHAPFWAGLLQPWFPASHRYLMRFHSRKGSMLYDAASGYPEHTMYAFFQIVPKSPVYIE